MAIVTPRISSRTRTRTTRKAAVVDTPPVLPPNVILLRQRVLPAHSAILARWIEAGRRMGLCDASAFTPNADTGANSYVLVWVRENIDPAYMIVPEGTEWVVVDAVRQQNLVRVRSFLAALNFIRPVLPLEAAA